MLLLLAFSDVHGKQRGLEYIQTQVQSHSPDLIVVSGDLFDHSDMEVTMTHLSSLETQIFYVPGNMDPPSIASRLKGRESTIIDIQGKRQVFKGVGFVGAGVSDTSNNVVSMISPGDVFVSHFPAKGYNDRAYSGAHAGSESILDIVKKGKPGLVLTGHIHESPGIMKDNNTIFVNPGPAYENKGALIKISDTIDVSFLL